MFASLVFWCASGCVILAAVARGILVAAPQSETALRPPWHWLLLDAIANTLSPFLLIIFAFDFFTRAPRSLASSRFHICTVHVCRSTGWYISLGKCKIKSQIRSLCSRRWGKYALSCARPYTVSLAFTH